jgi:hypothetical protein
LNRAFWAGCRKVRDNKERLARSEEEENKWEEMRVVISRLGMIGWRKVGIGRMTSCSERESARSVMAGRVVAVCCAGETIETRFKRVEDPGAEFWEILHSCVRAGDISAGLIDVGRDVGLGVDMNQSKINVRVFVVGGWSTMMLFVDGG